MRVIRAGLRPALALIVIAHGLMERRMMMQIKALAEQRERAGD